jgi:phospholipase/carboxylesterase
MDLRRGEAGGLGYIELAPEGAAPDLPLLVGMHGRGAAAEDLGGLCAYLDDQHYRYVLFYAPMVLLMGDGIRYAWFNREALDETLPPARERVLAALPELWGRYDAGPARTVLFGFSQGGMMTLDVGLRLEERLAGLVCMSGRLMPSDDLGPLLARARDRDQSILLVHGTYDSVVDIEGARAGRIALEKAGLHPEYLEFPMDHQVTPESLAAVRAYIQRVLPPA